MGPRWARRPEEGSPQESAGVPANTRERARKKANSELLTFVYWWPGRESNPRHGDFQTGRKSNINSHLRRYARSKVRVQWLWVALEYGSRSDPDRRAG